MLGSIRILSAVYKTNTYGPTQNRIDCFDIESDFLWCASARKWFVLLCIMNPVQLDRTFPRHPVYFRIEPCSRNNTHELEEPSGRGTQAVSIIKKFWSAKKLCFIVFALTVSGLANQSAVGE